VVTVTSPNGGEAFTSRDVEPIEWTTNGTKKEVAEVVLKYTTNGGDKWIEIESIDGNPEAYDWTVPDLSEAKDKCRVKVLLKDSDGNKVGKDESNSDFTINPIVL
jgi:hypothetical protein